MKEIQTVPTIIEIELELRFVDQRYQIFSLVLLVEAGTTLREVGFEIPEKGLEANNLLKAIKIALLVVKRGDRHIALPGTQHLQFSYSQLTQISKAINTRINDLKRELGLPRTKKARIAHPTVGKMFNKSY